MPKIVVDIENCWDCPYLGKRNNSPHMLYDVFCRKTKDRKIIGRPVGYRFQMPPIPEWCPCLMRNMQLVKQSDVYKLAGEDGIIHAHVADVDQMKPVE